MKKAAYFIITLEVTPPQKVANFLITLYSYDFFLVLHLMDNFGGITFLSVCIWVVSSCMLLWIMPRWAYEQLLQKIYLLERQGERERQEEIFYRWFTPLSAWVGRTEAKILGPHPGHPFEWQGFICPLPGSLLAVGLEAQSRWCSDQSFQYEKQAYHSTLASPLQPFTCIISFSWEKTVSKIASSILSRFWLSLLFLRTSTAITPHPLGKSVCVTLSVLELQVGCVNEGQVVAFERETPTQIFHLLMCSPNAWDSWDSDQV